MSLPGVFGVKCAGCGKEQGVITFKTNDDYKCQGCGKKNLISETVQHQVGVAS